MEYEEATVTVILVATLCKIPEFLLKRMEELEIKEGIKTVQTTAPLRSARQPRFVVKTVETPYH